MTKERESERSLTEAELKTFSTKPTLGRAVVMIMGVIATLVAAIDAVYFRQFPFWLNPLLFMIGGILVAKGRGAL